VVALALARYGTGSNNAPDCGRKVVVTNDKNGKSVTATVADACPGCKNYNSLDLSVGAFNAIATEAEGVVPISWHYVN
jgi:rare lipoprotein A (peptidoglycan hydrolase)